MRTETCRHPQLGALLLAIALAPMASRAAPLPQSVRASPATLARARAEQPQRVLRAGQELLSMRRELGLGEREAFRVRDAFTSPQGNAIVHFEHTFDGHRVWGSGAIAHVLADGSVRVLTEGLVTGAFSPGEPVLAPKRGLELVLRHLAAKDPLAAEPTVERVLFPARFVGGLAAGTDPVTGLPVLDRKRVVHAKPATGFVWAYEIRAQLRGVHDGVREPVYVIDASTGELLRIDDALEHSGTAPVATPATGTANGYYSGPISLDTVRFADGTHALFDPTRGSQPNPQLARITPDDSGWTPSGMQVWYEEHDQSGNSTNSAFLFQLNPVNVWGDGLPFTQWGFENDTNGQSTGVDALHGLATTWDFYRDVFGRDGFDGQGTATWAQVLNTDTYYIDNSSWSDYGKMMTLGAGSYPRNPKGFLALDDLDIVAHEMTHGLSISTAILRGYDQTEEFGVSEATSDFFSQMVKAWAARPAGADASVIPDQGTDWQIGKTAGRGTPIRWMDKASRDQRSRDLWHDGIKYMDGHFQAGVLNRALFFLAHGSSATPGADDYSSFLPAGMSGVGNDTAARIYFKALTERLLDTGNGSVTLQQVRDQAVQAALELYPNDAAMVVAVENAFGGVNVGAPHGLPPPVRVIFTNWRNGDYIDAGHYGGFYANRQVFPRRETVSPRITVQNTSDSAVAWTTGGPSMFNGANSSTTQGGRINADGSWTTPNELGWYAITATSHADPRQLAEGRCFLINTDTDMDLETDALDMGGIAFSWYLGQGISFAHSVFIAPWVDDDDVAYFVDAAKATWVAP